MQKIFFFTAVAATSLEDFEKNQQMIFNNTKKAIDYANLEKLRISVEEKISALENDGGDEPLDFAVSFDSSDASKVAEQATQLSKLGTGNGVTLEQLKALHAEICRVPGYSEILAKYLGYRKTYLSGTIKLGSKKISDFIDDALNPPVAK